MHFTFRGRNQDRAYRYKIEVIYCTSIDYIASLFAKIHARL